jgi:hypothetical protein
MASSMGGQMDRDRSARRTQHEIVRLCHTGLDSRTLRVEALRRLRKVVPVDALFCATVDPGDAAVHRLSRGGDP